MHSSLVRLTKDVNVVDTRIPFLLASSTSYLFNFAASIVTIAIVLPQLTPLIGLCSLCYIIPRVFLRTSRELRRIDSILRSPLQANFSETLSGLCTLRAYQAERRFVTLNRQLTDAANRADYLLYMATRWLGVTPEVTVRSGVACCTGDDCLARDDLSESGWIGAGLHLWVAGLDELVHPREYVIPWMLHCTHQWTDVALVGDSSDGSRDGDECRGAPRPLWQQSCSRGTSHHSRVPPTAKLAKHWAHPI